MKKFTVKPRLFHTSQALVGSSEQDSEEWVLLGRLSEAGQLTSIQFDVNKPHVIAIFGKRGSGKSYTLGTILESLCTQNLKTSISSISRNQGGLLFDTLGIFQWMQVGLESDSKKEVVRTQQAVQRGWNLIPESLDTWIWIPEGTRTDTTPDSHMDFAINCSDFTASDWGYLLNLDIYQDRMGQLLNDTYIKVVFEGWQEGSRHHAAKELYTIEDLISCIKQDSELQESYQSETRRAVIQQLTTFKRNPLFREHGTTLAELLQPGKLSVLVMNRMSDELRLVLISALIRRIISARIEASEIEKHLKILPELTAEQRQELKRKVAQTIPPSWVSIDEAQNILPSERRTTATDVLIRFVREGRNYGLSFIVATQQPSAIDQRILAQVDTIIAHKLTVQGDIDYVRRNLKSNLPSDVKYSNTQLSFDELVRSLDVGQAFISDTETSRGFILEIRPRVSVHGGF